MFLGLVQPKGLDPHAVKYISGERTFSFSVKSNLGFEWWTTSVNPPRDKNLSLQDFHLHLKRAWYLRNEDILYLVSL